MKYIVLFFILNNILLASDYINPDGNNWIVLDSVTSRKIDEYAFIHSISCIDSLNFASLSGGFFFTFEFAKIKITSDGGKTWDLIKEDIRPDNTPLIKHIFMSNKNSLFAVCDSGIVHFTSDRGKIWKKIKLDIPKSSYNAIEIAQCRNNFGILTYSGQNNIFVTYDGGENWQKFVFNGDDAPDYPCARINILNDSSIIMMGVKKKNSINYNVYYLSENTAKTWKEIYRFKTSDDSLLNRAYIDENRVFAIKSETIYKAQNINEIDTIKTDIYYSENQGQDWKSAFSEINPGFSYSNMMFSDSLNGYATNMVDRLIITKDGGKTWNKYLLKFDGIFRNYFIGAGRYLNNNTPIIGLGPLLMKFVDKQLGVDEDNSQIVGSIIANKYEIKYENALKYELYDFNAKMIKSEEIKYSGNHVINMETLPDGIYLLLVYLDNSITRKILLKN